MNTKPAMKILVIEDDPDGRRSVTDALTEAGYAVTAVAGGEEGVQRFAAEPFNAVLTDVRLPDIDGHEVLIRIRKQDQETPVLLMTAYGTVAAAVAALKSGAYDYILKPLNLADLQSKVAHAVESRQLRSQVTTLKAALHAQSSSKAIIAKSANMLEVLKQVQAVASTRATVLILGESGVGKELVARALHYDGNRVEAAFVAVNCGAFSESLLESELFGHEKGAFTGAMTRHVGAFERAHGGSLFLDEIGIAPPSVQARLLRVLETREFMRVGGNEPIAVDVRIISATNRNPEDLVAEKLFRQDLLYRLQVVTIRIPPLRERREDIRPLTDHFLAMACAEYGRHIESVAPACYEILERYAWPGNVRELKNALETAALMATAPTLKPADLHLGNAGAPGGATVIPATMPLEELEKQAILQSLQRHKGSRTLASEELVVSLRTIQRKIKEYNLPF
ncbi:MAG: sigma-54 dependent transcriptional regulator [Verrucomicrobia bacterium]|nr:sigma-54 dependent transcriptional regulator [Verrucomicrobiota bacterium]MBU4248206.1 sigma-54 dependent transcriptional regulator [Verrucomicrobiota bacterium]MBU4429976.1 sigma-54 dependent transcriptional regulator [Verrucomicrobiota bacterium]MBU4497398.1 sigma-54 dependent transcriptional regulator [Verrucomicrobiota bacterium]MCG2679904.1 sigma-54 dependent transcriptional regulator [Kiritimatiellia bacterium]